MKIHTLFFSPTGTTEKIIRNLGKELIKDSKYTLHETDFTLPDARKTSLSFNEKDFIIIGVPVYAGRVPNVLLEYLNTIKGNGARAAAVVLYGNRNYDDALLELRDILKNNGFKVIAGAAFIGEHSFSTTLAAGRPDSDDLQIVIEFAHKLKNKVEKNQDNRTIQMKGSFPYRPYYRPKNPYGEAVDIRKVSPKTLSTCIQCKICSKACPMGSISFEDASKMIGICIKCGACLKKCPVNAKYYDDIDYLRHKEELEHDFQNRIEAEFFI